MVQCLSVLLVLELSSKRVQNYDFLALRGIFAPLIKCFNHVKSSPIRPSRGR